MNCPVIQHDMFKLLIMLAVLIGRTANCRERQMSASRKAFADSSGETGLM